MPALGFVNNEIIGSVVLRRPVYEPPQRTPASRNVRPIEKVYPQESPSPPRQGDIPSRPARMPIVTFQSVASILAVMKDQFVFPQFAPHFTASTTTWPGGHTAAVSRWHERINVKRDGAQPYGSMFALVSDDRYRLLMGAQAG